MFSHEMYYCAVVVFCRKYLSLNCLDVMLPIFFCDTKMTNKFSVTRNRAGKTAAPMWQK